MSRSAYFINSSNTIVDDNLEGTVLYCDGAYLDKKHRIVLRKDLETLKATGKVILICGGGSGHEPSHAGFVGKGMLSAAVCGDIFASPPVNNILTALHATYSPAGTVVIVKNYTGDRLNFGLAIEQFKIHNVDAKIDMILVEDDVATRNSPVGARGICGTVFLYKILGALAENGNSFGEIVEYGHHLQKKILTLGVSLAHCCIPGQKVRRADVKKSDGKASTETYEIGLGIHNEEGVEKRPLETVTAVVNSLLQTLLDNLRQADHDRFVLIFNNLGGLSQIEVNIVVKEVISGAQGKGLSIPSIFVGSFMTSLAMPGFSVTLIPLDDHTERCLTSTTDCPFWPRMLPVNREPFCTLPEITAHTPEIKSMEKDSSHTFSDDNSTKFRLALNNACDIVIQEADRLNDIDAAAGDGDCGTTLKQLGEETKVMIADETTNFNNPTEVFWKLSVIAGNTGGTSGALYGILFGAFASKLKNVNDRANWSYALEGALDIFMRYSRATPGQKSMLDALVALEQSMRPLREASVSMQNVLLQCVKDVEMAAENTKNLSAAVGRESYSGKSATGIPDAGAYCVALWVKAAGESLLQT
ncbi:triokinase/FMN cyclase-like [Paramacrobiotus metropolitanus]|uniref:triokinase/FMN cyclase-like n=1 Tax=Paramacrobiotus metropolitanus TaxID=2943436 RepID=UPI002445A27F|nr:triokinase/FMN cyclase-like [Paramacrobiotus metropolitanus]